MICMDTLSVTLRSIHSRGISEDSFRANESLKQSTGFLGRSWIVLNRCIPSKSVLSRPRFSVIDGQSARVLQTTLGHCRGSRALEENHRTKAPNAANGTPGNKYHTALLVLDFHSAPHIAKLHTTPHHEIGGAPVVHR